MILKTIFNQQDMKNSKQLRWKKKLLSCRFQLFADNQQVGHLKDSELSRSATGELNNKRYRFTTHSHLHPKTEIFDLEKNQKVGQIRYNCWYPKARIEYGGKTSQWKFSNIWETKWRIFHQSETAAQFSGWEKKGSIKVNVLDEALILAGLYISNYYWRLAAIIIASLAPILIFLA